MALLRARETAMAKFRPLLSQHDLTEQQWRVLRALASTDNAVTVGQLVDATTLLAPSLTRILVKLESRGLINRSVARDDQRRSHLVLSAKGKSLVQRVAPQSEAAYNAIEAQFGEDRLANLLGELQAFTELAEDGAQPGSPSNGALGETA